MLAGLMFVVSIRTAPKASPCQGRCQKSSIFDGGVVKIINFSPSVAYGDSSLIRGSHGVLPYQCHDWFRR